MILRLIFGSAAASLAMVGCAFATTYDYTTLNVPDTQYTYGQGINDSGAVTGYDSGTGSGEAGFVFPAEPILRSSLQARAAPCLRPSMIWAL